MSRQNRASNGSPIALVVMLVISVCLTGCNLRPDPPGTLAADPNLEFMTPSLVLTEIELGPGDQLVIQVYRHPDLDRTVEVSRTGRIFLPLAGELDMSGATSLSARQMITEAYADYVIDPQVSVNVTVRRSQRVLVMGEVRQPGVFNLERPTSTLDVVALAGGFTLDGAKNAVYLHRLEGGTPVQRVLDMDRLLNHGEFENNPMVEAGDILYIPPSEFAKADRFARHVSTWLSPVLLTQNAILLGNNLNTTFGGSNVVIPVGGTTSTP